MAVFTCTELTSVAVFTCTDLASVAVFTCTDLAPHRLSVALIKNACTHTHRHYQDVIVPNIEINCSWQKSVTFHNHACIIKCKSMKG